MGRHPPGIQWPDVEEFAAAASAFLADAPHPTLGGRLRDGWYVPMEELLRYLEDHGSTCFIASGGSRDFMRVGNGLRRPVRGIIVVPWRTTDP
jgi:phosphoserine phosphatase